MRWSWWFLLRRRDRVELGCGLRGDDSGTLLQHIQLVRGGICGLRKNGVTIQDTCVTVASRAHSHVVAR